MQRGLERAVAICGRQGDLAREINNQVRREYGLSDQVPDRELPLFAFQQKLVAWREAGVPAEFARLIEIVTRGDVPRYELHPEAYPPAEWKEIVRGLSYARRRGWVSKSTRGLLGGPGSSVEQAS